MAALLTPSVVTHAQEQKKDIVSRRHYEKKQKKYTQWYNNISVKALWGPSLISSTSGYTSTHPKVSSNLNSYGPDTTIATILSVSYERLKRDDLLYYGPGIAANIDVDDGVFSVTTYFRGRLEFDLENTFLGYDISGLHPYISAAVGLTYIFSGEKELYRPNYEIYYNDHYYSAYNHTGSIGRWWSSDYYASPTNGIKFYLDYGAGFAIDCGKHKSIILGYRAILYPSISRKLNLSNHANEIETFVQQHYNSHSDGYLYIATDAEQVMRLYHGVEVSFRF